MRKYLALAALISTAALAKDKPATPPDAGTAAPKAADPATIPEVVKLRVENKTLKIAMARKEFAELAASRDADLKPYGYKVDWQNDQIAPIEQPKPPTPQGKKDAAKK